METAQLELRVSALEKEIIKLKQKLGDTDTSIPWWQQISGSFAESTNFDEAMKIGREYRTSLKDVEEE